MTKYLQLREIMKNKQNYIPDLILEQRRKNKHIVESLKNSKKRSCQEIIESIKKWNEDVEKMLSSK